MLRLRFLTSIVALSALTLFAMTAVSPVSAQSPLSEGCQALNAAFLDAFYISAGTSGFFEAGDRVTITAGAPFDPVPVPPAEIFLRLDGVVVASTPFPGTLVYT